MTMRKIAAHTLGCKVNQYDTQAMLELFRQAGYSVVSMNEDAGYEILRRVDKGEWTAFLSGRNA